MGAFLENSMFLFVDDAEPILPIFRSTGPTLRPGDIGRIVELADVGCDTEATFPVRFPRGASDRRRGGAESLGSARRSAKRPGDKPSGFARRAADVNNNVGGGRNHAWGNARRDDYDVYAADLDYDDSESLYGDLELLANDSDDEEEDYARFLDPRSAVARFRGKRTPRYDYSEDPESPFTQSIRVPERESALPRWLAENAERNVREMRGTNVRSAERRKRTKTLSRAKGGFDREAEFEEASHRERDDLPDAADPVAPTRNVFWDFIPFENDAGREEATFCKPTRTQNHGGLRKTAPRGRGACVFDSQPRRVDAVDSEEEEEETLKKDRRGNPSPEIPTNSARRRASKGDTVKEKPKTLRLTTNVTSSRGQSTKALVNERISNTYPAEKEYSVNTRPHSATKGRKIKSPIGKREEVATRTTVDDRRHHEKFSKFPNNFPKETGRSTRTFNRVADSRNNGRTYVANKRDNANAHRGNSGDKVDRINVAISSEKKITRNERTADTPRMEKEKEKKFASRLPVRIWKRLKTREPAALRPKNEETSGDVELQGTENETVEPDDRSARVENDDVRAKDRATANRNDVKRSGRSRTGSLSADKSRS